MKCLKPNLQYSPYFERYIQFFKEVQNKVQASTKDLCSDETNIFFHERLNEENIHSITLLQVERAGAVVSYRVRLGYVSVFIRMLHIPVTSSTHRRKIIGSGAFGIIVDVNQVFVAKRTYFLEKTSVLRHSTDGMVWKITGTHRQLSLVLYEVAAAKLCSYLQIGPKTGLFKSFDVVCYKDSVEFYMQQCHQVLYIPDHDQITSRLKYCVRLLHELHFIHKDIKPSNIMYSQSLRKFVLVDFGIMQSIKENIGEKTRTWREGTPKYMSPDMLSQKEGIIGIVDVYYNDLFGLQQTLNYFRGRAIRKPLSSYNDFRVAPQLFDQTRALQIASDIYGGLFQKKNITKLVEPIFEVLSEYFPEMQGHLFQSQKKWSEDLLVLSVGIGYELSIYFNYCQDSLKIKRAIDNFNLSCFQENKPFDLHHNSKAKYFLSKNFEELNPSKFQMKIQKQQNQFYINNSIKTESSLNSINQKTKNYEFQKKLQKLDRLFEICIEQDISNENWSQYFEKIKQNTDIKQQTFMKYQILYEISSKRKIQKQTLIQTIKILKQDEKLRFIVLAGILCYRKDYAFLSLTIFTHLKAIKKKLILKSKQINYRQLLNYLKQYFIQEIRNLQNPILLKLFRFLVNVMIDAGHHYDSIQLCQKYKHNKQPTIKYIILLGLANSYLSLENNKKALNYFKLSYNIAKEFLSENHQDLIIIRSKISLILSEIGEHQALKNILQVKIRANLIDKENYVMLIQLLGIGYIVATNLNVPSQSESFYNSLIELKKKIQFQPQTLAFKRFLYWNSIVLYKKCSKTQQNQIIQDCTRALSEYIHYFHQDYRSFWELDIIKQSRQHAFLKQSRYFLSELQRYEKNKFVLKLNEPYHWLYALFLAEAYHKRGQKQKGKLILKLYTSKLLSQTKLVIGNRLLLKFVLYFLKYSYQDLSLSTIEFWISKIQDISEETLFWVPTCKRSSPTSRFKFQGLQPIFAQNKQRTLGYLAIFFYSINQFSLARRCAFLEFDNKPFFRFFFGKCLYTQKFFDKSLIYFKLYQEQVGQKKLNFSGQIQRAESWIFASYIYQYQGQRVEAFYSAHKAMEFLCKIQPPQTNRYSTNILMGSIYQHFFNKPKVALSYLIKGLKNLPLTEDRLQWMIIIVRCLMKLKKIRSAVNFQEKQLRIYRKKELKTQFQMYLIQCYAVLGFVKKLCELLTLFKFYKAQKSILIRLKDIFSRFNKRWIYETIINNKQIPNDIQKFSQVQVNNIHSQLCKITRRKQLIRAQKIKERLLKRYENSHNQKLFI